MKMVSVVIPLYNKEKYIERAVRSVLMQSFQDFEIIVVDDGSTDGGADVVKQIRDPRIRLIEQKNQGVSAARNTGIDAAKESLVAFLDADDEWKPCFLERILKLMSSYPDAGAYATAYETRESKGKVTRPKFKAIPQHPWEGIIPSYFKSSLGSPPVWSSAVAIPRKVFDKVGKFTLGGRSEDEDLDMWLRIAIKYPIAFSNSIEAVYHKEATNRVSLVNYSTSDYKFVKTAKDAIRDCKISDKDKDNLIEYIYLKEIERAGRCMVSGEKKKARQLLRDSRSTRHFNKKRVGFFLLTFFPTSIVRLFRILKRRILQQS